MFTWSEQPYQDMWNHINFLGKRNTCKKLLKNELQSNRVFSYIDGYHLNKKVEQISMCINQAYEYFIAADEVSINTSPVLYFYGMLSLAKALIVANNCEIFLEDIKYHGLYTRPITEDLRSYKENPDSWEMEKEYAVTNEGVFHYLTKTLDDFTYNNGSIFRFKDILAVCPETSDMYEKYYNNSSQVLYLYSKKEEENPYKLIISPGEKNQQKIYSSIPELETDFTIQSAPRHGQTITFESNNLREVPSYLGFYESFIGGRYIVGGLKYNDQDNNIQKKYINLAISDYIAMFILSTIARYKQDFWGNIIEGKKSGVLGLVELYISVIKRRYPNIILNFLFNEEFRYGSPGYLT